MICFWDRLLEWHVSRIKKSLHENAVDLREYYEDRAAGLKPHGETDELRRLEKRQDELIRLWERWDPTHAPRSQTAHLSFTQDQLGMLYQAMGNLPDGFGWTVEEITDMLDRLDAAEHALDLRREVDELVR